MLEFRTVDCLYLFAASLNLQRSCCTESSTSASMTEVILSPQPARQAVAKIAHDVPRWQRLSTKPSRQSDSDHQDRGRAPQPGQNVARSHTQTTTAPFAKHHSACFLGNHSSNFTLSKPCKSASNCWKKMKRKTMTMKSLQNHHSAATKSPGRMRLHPALVSRPALAQQPLTLTLLKRLWLWL